METRIYDFRNQKWTSPLVPKSFGIKNIESFCVSAMFLSKEALESLIKKSNE